LHAQIAQALETQSPELMDSQPELLALHYAEAENPDKSVAYWGRAGRRSVARSAIAEAAAQFQKGLEQLTLMPDYPDCQRQELEFYSSLGAVLIAVKGYAAPETGRAYDRARELWEQLGCPSEFLGVPFGQSTYHAQHVEFDKAQRLADDMLSLSHKCHNSAGLVLGHFSVGRNLMFVGKFDLSRAHLERALALYDVAAHSMLVHQAGVDLRVASQAYLADVLLCLGFPDQALALSQSSISEAVRMAHQPSLAVSLSVGTLLLSLLEVGPVLAQRAVQLVAVGTDQGFPHWRAAGIMFHGWSRVKTGDVAEGVSLLRSGLSTYRSTGAELWVPRFIDLLAEGCEVAGDVEEAADLLDDALAVAVRTGELWFAAELNRRQGTLCLRRGQGDAAETLFCEALRIAREQNARLWELRAAVSLAQLRRHQGRSAAALDVLKPVCDWFTEGVATPDLQAAKILLHNLAVPRARRRGATAPAYSASSNDPRGRHSDTGSQNMGHTWHPRQ
jgi:predicted ATPase